MSAILPIISPTVSNPVGSPILGATASGSTPYLPNQRAGNQLWLDMSDTDTITASGGRVSAVLDKSTNAYTFLSPTAANQPYTGSVTINGLNTLTGHASNETVLDVVGNQTGALPLLDPANCEIHIIFEETAGADCEALICLNSSFGGDIIVGDWRGPGGGGLVPGPNSGYDFFGDFFTKGTAYLMTFRANATGYEIRRNGVVIKSVTYGGGEAMTAFNRFLVFSRAGGSQESDVSIGEIIAGTYSSDASLALDEGYLMHKWGL